MTSQHDPEGRRPRDYIDRDTSVGWAPMILGIAFVGLLAMLMFGTIWGPTSDKPDHSTEVPKTTPPISTPPKQE